MRKIQKCLSFVLCECNMAGQSKHFEQLDCLIVDIGEDDLRAALFGDVDNAEEN